MFSKSCKYGIRAVLYLAIHGTNDRNIGVGEMAEALSVPKHFLAKILQQLTRYRLISSAKGRNGGFYLDTENKRSTLLSVIVSIDGPGTLEDCVLGLTSCSDENPCPYHNAIKDYRDSFLKIVSNETIEESALRIKTLNLRLKNII